MAAEQLGHPIENGMVADIVARPNFAKFGNLSLWVNKLSLAGEGAIQRAFLLLQKKLAAEGLFDARRKRPLPDIPHHIGVISSLDAAGYQDFIKIINQRLRGLTIDVIHTQVQGDIAAPQIVAAIKQFNELADPPQVLAIIRGGGSRNDLRTFDDERLVRAVAASRIPIISGVGHEIDTTLIDMVADVRAATPSNCAELLVPTARSLNGEVDSYLATARATVDNLVQGYQHHADSTVRQIAQRVYNQNSNIERRSLLTINRIEAELRRRLQSIHNINRMSVSHISSELTRYLQDVSNTNDAAVREVGHHVTLLQSRLVAKFDQLTAVLPAYNPRDILRRGYAILFDGQAKHALTAVRPCDKIVIETDKQLINAKVTNVKIKR